MNHYARRTRVPQADLLHQATADEPRFHGLLESAPDAIVIVDGAGQIVAVNHQAEQLFGYDRHELIGQAIEVLLPARLRAAHIRQRAGYLADPHTRPMGARLELVAQRKDGSEFPAEISLSPMQMDDGLLVTSIIRDISTRHHAAQELERQMQERTAHLNALLQFSQELLLAHGLDAVLQRAMRHAVALLPQAERGAIYLYAAQSQRLELRASVGTRQLANLSVPLDLEIMSAAFSGRRVQQADSTEELLELAPALRSDQRQQFLQMLDLPQLPTGMIAIPLVAHEAAIGVILLLRLSGAGPFAAAARATLEGLANLTAAAIVEEQSLREAAALSSQLARLEEQQRSMAARLTSAEAAVLQAARLAAVGQLAAAIAHEINNPLYAARNCLYLLEDDQPGAPGDPPYLRIAQDQLTRIAGIIERMRDFYRPPRGEILPCDINELLESTLTLAGLNTRHAAIDIIFTPASGLPEVRCSGDQLRQVFLNLILNAIEAMPAGGTLTVRTLAGQTVAVVEIADTGIGIPDDIRAHLFEPFFTNKPNGTGLGLSISAHIVTQHGGRIEVESSAGQGSTFRVVLPYQPST
jgi:two-component system NtrC family sensor kinase